jgi:hypothetical protein
MTTVTFCVNDPLVVSHMTCHCHMFQDKLRASESALNTVSHCVHIDLLPNCCAIMQQPFTSTSQRFSPDTKLHSFLVQQLQTKADVILLPSSRASGIVKYLVIMSASEVINGHNPPPGQHHVTCTFHMKPGQCLVGKCSYQTCIKGMMKNYERTNFPLPASERDTLCKHMQKVFARPEVTTEFLALLSRTAPLASPLSGVLFDCETDRWKPCDECPQTSIPWTPSTRQSAIFMDYSTGKHLEMDSDIQRTFDSDNYLIGKPCRPAWSANCHKCSHAMAEQDYFDTGTVILQYSSDMRCVRRSVHTFKCSSHTCTWSKVYDADVDCLHYFGRTGRIWHAGRELVHFCYPWCLNFCFFSQLAIHLQICPASHWWNG